MDHLRFIFDRDLTRQSNELRNTELFEQIIRFSKKANRFQGHELF